MSETAQTIFAQLQTADNKILWAYAQEIVSLRKQSSKPQVKEVEQDNIFDGVDLEDKDAMRKVVLTDLLRESKNGNAQASAHFSKIAGLEETKQNVYIQTIDYSEWVAQNEKPRKKRGRPPKKAVKK